MALDRSVWREVTKSVGLAYCVQTFYDTACYNSNKRHMKVDTTYIPKSSFRFMHTTKVRDLKVIPYIYNLVGLSEAIESGAVTVGRGRHESKNKVSTLVPKKLQFATVKMSYVQECIEALAH